MVLTNHIRGRGCAGITIFRGLADKVVSSFASLNKDLRAEIYNKEYAHDFYSKISGHSIYNHIYLKDVPVPGAALTDDKMPLYINIPILSVYAKERLAGRIPMEAL